MRWDPYVLREGDGFDTFWGAHLKGGTRKLLFVLGRGFDLRADAAPKKIIEMADGSACHAWLLNYQNGQPDSELRTNRIQENVRRFEVLFGAAGITSLDVKMRGAGNSNVTSRNTKSAVTRRDELVCRF
jgi:hypothetical protein